MTATLFDPGERIIGSIQWATRGQRARWRQQFGDDVRGAPRDLFSLLDAEFGFTVDVAASPDNALCPRYFTEETDGLAQDWTGERCWMNPPYSNIAPWAKKAATEHALTVGLLPARTDLGWFHDHVLATDAEIRFLRGRLRFGAPGGAAGRHNAPFASLIVVWRNA